MANVLGRVEDTEGEAVQEVAGGQQAHDGAQCESGTVLEEFGDAVELRDGAWTVATVLDQEREHVLVLATGIVREHGDELVEDGGPGIDLHFGVLDMRDGLAPIIGQTKRVKGLEFVKFRVSGGGRRKKNKRWGKRLSMPICTEMTHR